MGAFDYGKSSAKRVAQIVNRWSSGGVSDAIAVGITPGKSLSIGSTTAGVLKRILSISGAGAINIAAVSAADTTSRTLRLKITVDGIVIFDATSSAIATAGWGVIGIGWHSAAALSSESKSAISYQRIEFDKSVLIECASSLTEATPGLLHVAYEVMQ